MKRSDENESWVNWFFLEELNPKSFLKVLRFLNLQSVFKATFLLAYACLIVAIGQSKRCMEYPNFTQFPGPEKFFEKQFPQSFRRFARNSAETVFFHKIFHTRKLVAILIFYAVQAMFRYFQRIVLQNKCILFPK